MKSPKLTKGSNKTPVLNIDLPSKTKGKKKDGNKTPSTTLSPMLTIESSPSRDGAPLPDGTPLRKLGPTEDMYWRFDSVCPLYFGTICRLSGPLNLDHLHAAWSAVRRRHPLLMAKIVPDGEHHVPWFVHVESEMDIEVRAGPPDDAWAMLEESLVTPFEPETAPLVRCVVLEHGDSDWSLVTTFHHAISDGRSATFVLRDLMEALAHQSLGEAAALEPLPLMDYYGDRIHTLKGYKSWDDFRDAMGKTWGAAFKFLRTSGVPMGLEKTEKIPLAEQELCIEPRTIDTDDMKRVIKRAKAEGVTVQCVLNAALSKAVAEDRTAKGIRVTACTQVLDVRSRLIPAVGEDCGLFVSGSTSMHRIGPDTDYWDFARDIRVGLTAALETPLPYFHPAIHKSYAFMAREIGEKRAKAFSQVLSRMHPEGLCVSNLGRIKVEVPDSPVQLQGFAFATNTNVLNSFNTSVASCNGRMVWSFSASSVVGREKLREVADRSIELIMEAVHAPVAVPIDFDSLSIMQSPEPKKLDVDASIMQSSEPEKLDSPVTTPRMVSP